VISEEIIQRIIDENDIVDVITESGVRLKRSGRNYFGLCPFHHENSPSFSVSPEKQIFKCFGCGEAGNVIGYVMKNKNMSYYDTLKYLAERVNIQVEENKAEIENKKRIQRFYDINVDAARYFFSNLMKNKEALSYFTGRGIELGTIKSFGLGYALDSWGELLKYLKSKKYTDKEILSLGLAIEGKNNRIYDRFRNRVIFPVFDYKGNVIGFGGRVLDDSKPKYLNSPESRIFEKRKNLYGLNFAIKKGLKDYVIIVEGYMDAISLHQFGVTNVVATLGTALTTEQAKLLKRYVNKVIIAYDADFAGQSATMRGLKILKEAGFLVYVLRIPEGKDPDEYIRNNGKLAFVKLVEAAESLTEYRISSLEGNFNIDKQEEKIAFINEAANVLKESDPIERDIYVKKLAEKTYISEQAIYDKIAEKGINANLEQQEYNFGDNGQNLYLEKGYIKAERALLKILLQKEEYTKFIVDNISVEEMILDSHKFLYNLILGCMDVSFEEKVKSVQLKCTDNDSFKELTHILLEEINYEEVEVEKLIEDYILSIKKNNLEIKKRELVKKIKQCEAAGDIQETIVYVKELEEIQRNLKSFTNA